MDEIWKMIPGYDYAVSNTGKVASMKKGWRVLKPDKTEKGYLRVSLQSKGERKFVRIHRLVADAFLPAPDSPLKEINHKNGDKMDNVSPNLEWTTRSENVAHSHRVLGNVGPRGEKQGSSKLTKSDVLAIREESRNGVRQDDIAARYGVTQANISSIICGNTWGWLK